MTIINNANKTYPYTEQPAPHDLKYITDVFKGSHKGAIGWRSAAGGAYDFINLDANRQSYHICREATGDNNYRYSLSAGYISQTHLDSQVSSTHRSEAAAGNNPSQTAYTTKESFTPESFPFTSKGALLEALETLNIETERTLNKVGDARRPNGDNAHVRAQPSGFQRRAGFTESVQERRDRESRDLPTLS